MMNICEYFNNLYNEAATGIEFDAILDHEIEVHDMEDGFEEWAAAHNIDLTIVNPQTGITYLQHWDWDFDN